MQGIVEAGQRTRELLPLTGAQKWLMGEMHKYRHPGWVCLEFTVKTKVPMNAFALKEAAWYLVARYENLRVRIYHKDGQWCQELYPLAESNIYAQYDLSGEPAATRTTVMRDICIKERDWLLPGRGNIIRILYFKYSETEGRLWFCVHHVVSDFVSMLVLSGDYLTAYTTIIQGKELKRQVVTDYRKWMYIVEGYARDVLLPAQLEYWITLPWEKAALLPGDYPEQYPDLQAITRALHSKQLIGAYKTCEHTLPQSNTLRLLSIYGLDFESILIAVFFIALCTERGVSCLDIAASHAGRNLLPADYAFSENRLVGYIALVRILLLIDPGGPDNAYRVQLVAEEIRKIPGGGTGFTLIGDQIKDPAIKTAYDQLRKQPQIFFNYLGATSTTLNNEQYEIVSEDIGRYIHLPEVKDSLFECSAAVNQGQLQITLTYIEDYMKESSTQAILQRMSTLLHELAAMHQPDKSVLNSQNNQL